MQVVSDPNAQRLAGAVQGHTCRLHRELVQKQGPPEVLNLVQLHVVGVRAERDGLAEGEHGDGVHGQRESHDLRSLALGRSCDLRSLAGSEEEGLPSWPWRRGPGRRGRFWQVPADGAAAWLLRRCRHPRGPRRRLRQVLVGECGRVHHARFHDGRRRVPIDGPIVGASPAAEDLASPALRREDAPHDGVDPAAVVQNGLPIQLLALPRQQPVANLHAVFLGCAARLDVRLDADDCAQAVRQLFDGCLPRRLQSSDVQARVAVALNYQRAEDHLCGHHHLLASPLSELVRGDRQLSRQRLQDFQRGRAARAARLADFLLPGGGDRGEQEAAAEQKAQRNSKRSADHEGMMLLAKLKNDHGDTNATSHQGGRA
mmetsp:Transcript_175401/g.562716  ORF Transcript_175401/g.562716 Transcript_175401/m.562716 type:complete len:372 (+) Transcript_175401:853-1968(+)